MTSFSQPNGTGTVLAPANNSFGQTPGSGTVLAPAGTNTVLGHTGASSSFAQQPGIGTVLSSPSYTLGGDTGYQDTFSTSGFWDTQGSSQGGAPGSTLSAIGIASQITGSILGAIGAFASAQAQKDQLKGQAMTLEFQQSMANLNARQAEDDAQAILRAGRGEIGRLTLAAGQEKGRARVSAAARGVTVGVGSAAEIEASIDLVKEIDAMTINENSVRAAGQARMQATNSRNQSLLAGVSAGNLRRTAGTINPAQAAGNSMLVSGGRFAANQDGRFAANFGRRS